MKLATFLPYCRRALALGAGTSLLAACSYTNGFTNEPPAPCALPTTVSYATHIQPILVTNCRNACHNPTTASFYANFNMDDISQVQYWTTHRLDGRAVGTGEKSALVGNIRHDPGFNNMPQIGAKLSDCQIALIEAWVKAGSLNN